MKVSLIALLALPVLAFAQQAPPPNLIRNGGFDQFADEDNLWDGVDDAGCLAGDALGDDMAKKPKPAPNGVFFQSSRHRIIGIDAILDGGNVGRMPMPLSLQVADLNHDGLLDLITVDTSGYFRVYFNSGSPTQPKFTHAELVPLYLGRFRWANEKGWWRRHYGDGLKLALGDFTHNGSLDLLLGNYYGNLMLVKNTGSIQMPEWKQPGSIDQIKLSTNKDGRLWANLLAPAAYDWLHHNKLDILVGEGSYSANAIHLIPNTTGETKGSSGFVGTASFGSNSALPTFNDEAREYLAYGDGREQLVPAVVDYNGDGIPDLIVGDRTGEINVYLSEGPWKSGSGQELKRQPKPISFGGVTSIGEGPKVLRCVSPTVADLNGDGKFDILVGKPDGRISVSYNIGTAKEPKFGPLVDLKGEKVFKKGSIRSPSDWGVDFGFLEGNFMGYYTVVTPQEDPQAAGATGTHVLKAGYCPTLNRIIRRAFTPLPTDEALTMKASASFNPDGVTPHYWGEPFWRGTCDADSNVLVLRQEQGWNALKPNTRYQLSFRVKGQNIRNGHVCLAFGGWLLRDEAAAKAHTGGNDVSDCEAQQIDFDFNVGSSWTSFSRVVSFRFSHSDLNAFDKWNKSGSKIQYKSILDWRASLMSDDAVIYIDSIKLTPM